MIRLLYTMKICKKCGIHFKTQIKVDGKLRNLCNRTFCLSCSPMGAGNRIDITKLTRGDCIVCGAALKGNARLFCSGVCKSKRNSKDPIQKAGNYAAQQGRALCRKLHFIQTLGNCCKICGYNKNYAALHFHHTDATQKSFSIDSRKISNTRMSVLEKEVSKCELLCANCHAERHHPNLTLDITR